MKKRTKIVATVGPASDTNEIIENLINEGVNVFRLNFSHGDYEYHKKTIDKIRNLSKKAGKVVGVLQDICGPKIRCSKLEEDFILKSGDELSVLKNCLVGKKIDENKFELGINHPEILDLLKVDEYIYFYDGSIKAKVVATSEDKITTKIVNDCKLSSNKGVNFPNTKLNIEVITPKDRADLEWGAKNGVDFVAISFVQSPNDVKKAREILKSLNSSAKIFAKIEKFEAIENIDEIIEASDGIMVARGDLGIEVPFYKVPILQKLIISKANAAAKPVITATQMMLSMAKNETATRAEISDVANAVFDGTDAVMLSEESAVGINPVAVVRSMSKTIIQAEEFYKYGKFDEYSFDDETDMVASSAATLATRLKAKALISITSSGGSARKIARNRPKMDILAVTHSEQSARALSIVWGVEPCLVVQKSKLNILLSDVISTLIKIKKINHDFTYVLTAGHPAGAEGSTNLIRILHKEQLEYYQNAAI